VITIRVIRLLPGTNIEGVICHKPSTRRTTSMGYNNSFALNSSRVIRLLGPATDHVVRSLDYQLVEHSTSNINTTKSPQTGQKLPSTDLWDQETESAYNKIIPSPRSSTGDSPPDLPLRSSSTSNHHPHKTISSALSLPTF
jgi:hypothetical protein